MTENMKSHKSPKVALCQMMVGQDKDENLERAEAHIQSAAASGADFIVLPEMFLCPYENGSFSKYAEITSGQTIARLSRICAYNSIWLIAGSIPERDGSHIYNTSYVFNRSGDIVAKHRKVHLFDINIPGAVSFLESDTLTAGNEVTVFDTEFGRFGLAICYDIRFPEFFRLMADAGVNGVFVPAAFNMTTGPAHWHLTARMRAVDNQFFVMLCSPARREDMNYVAYGHSLIADPWGDIVDELDEVEGMLVAELNFSRMLEVRKRLPLMQHRRRDLYEVVFRKNNSF